MMQMEWCNQFDSSIRIHRREEEREKGVGVGDMRKDFLIDYCALM